MIALSVSLALALQSNVQVASNPGAPAVPGVGFTCYLSIDGQSTVFTGRTPSFPAGHAVGVRLPMRWEVARGPAKYAGERWISLPVDYPGNGGVRSQASENHRHYVVPFRVEGEPDAAFTMILVKDFNGLGVLEQGKRPVAKASCTSDFSSSDAKGTAK